MEATGSVGGPRARASGEEDTGRCGQYERRKETQQEEEEEKEKEVKDEEVCGTIGGYTPLQNVTKISIACNMVFHRRATREDAVLDAILLRYPRGSLEIVDLPLKYARIGIVSLEDKNGSHHKPSSCEYKQGKARCL